ncbi:methyltransferase domain-containing protein [Paenibacillus sepulcri]|uniref:Methyltransferase domain-containing protein n=1 Tax=Paenibacillus sepulcri TaxID=359917 RepID=A0ABS7CH91_9BACL|nr:methyltransferase domain-containing protein [Paenibacillus sepulcri]
MDDFAKGGPELREAPRHLRRLNRIFAAAAPTLLGVRRLWMEAGRPASLSILDAGSGSGDVNAHLLNWADRNKIAMTITLVDLTEEACVEARILFRNEPRVKVIRKDLFALQEGIADVVTGTQFVHHFPEDELPGVVERLLDVSRLGVVINDIHRHFIPWSAVWLTARLISKNPYIRHDGPLSVAKGFRSSDWRKLQLALENPHMTYSWRPLFRYAVVIQKTSPTILP